LSVRDYLLAVDLVTAYSNRLDLATSLVKTLEQLRRAQERATDAPAGTVWSTGRSERQWRVSDRLSEADLRVMVAAAEQGTPKWQLAEKYGVSESSIKRIVRKHRKQQAAKLSEK
jgi:hypothetical protein